MKNRTMRVAALLLTLTLMTSCFVGGTFAKYTTAGESMDSARVAKFGVTVTADFARLFANGYKLGTYDAVADEDNSSVWATAEDVVAPGTSGKLPDFTVAGTPEVDVRVSYIATLELGDNWFVDANHNGTKDADEYEYCPMIFTVNDINYYMGKDGIDTVAKLEAAVKAAIEAADEEYTANTNLANEVKNDLKISWTWAFEKGIEHQNDTNDTILGNQAAGGYVTTVSLSVSCTVEQID